MYDNATERRITEAATSAQKTGYLDLSGLDLTELPGGFDWYANLRGIDLSGCYLRGLPEWFGRLTKLETLDLARNPLRGFPDVIGRLEGLRALGLCGTGVIDLPPSVAALQELSTLVISANNITVLPVALRYLRSLRRLDLANNRLEALPDTLGGLEALSQLYLWGNRLRHVPAVLKKFSKLQVLDLSNIGEANRAGQLRQPFESWGVTRVAEMDARPRPGGIVGVPGWLFEALSQLTYVYLEDNRIEQLPRTVATLSQLQGLSVRNNRLGTFPDGLLPANIEYLDLSRNRISTVPHALRELGRLKYLDLTSNPLPIPVEILERKQDPKAISDFVTRVTISTRPLDEAKLLVVGEGSVGKTSLIKRLVHNQFSRHEGKTEGIDITRWQVSVGTADVTLNTWDFGGQEIMHATHQFFLTRRSIYMLVIDSRQDEDQNRVEYWLKLIQSFSGGSPVIVVGNKSDEAPLDIDQRGLRSKYPDIIDIASTSCLEAAGIDELRKTITAAVAEMPHVHDLLPEQFFAVKESLEEMEVDYLPFEQFEELCRHNAILAKESQELLIGFLHDLGTVLCFRDDPRLASTNILNPAWVTGGVYRILNSNLAAQRKGLLRSEDINDILGSAEYPRERRFFIIDMMKKFELCFEADGIFLIPDLLTKEEPYTGSWDGALEFAVKYDVLPSSVMSRLIVRMNAMIYRGTVWRTGVVLMLDQNRALVKADREDALITIHLIGVAPGRRGLLTSIRSVVRSITDTIPGLGSEELVSVPRYPGVTVPYGHLIELEAAGRTVVVPQGLTHDVKIRELLDGVEAPDERADRAETAGGRAIDTAPTPPAHTHPGGPWTASQSLMLGLLLLASTVMIFGVAALAHTYLGDSLIPTLLSAFVVVIGLGMFVLRTSGRVSEKGFLAAIKDLLRAQSKIQPPPP